MRIRQVSFFFGKVMIEKIYENQTILILYWGVDDRTKNHIKIKKKKLYYKLWFIQIN